ncbi:MAG: OmpA family protein [Acidobacteria bacterium]|nr:MAG: OmpA family protein [Acidobacteriota bacterium]
MSIPIPTRRRFPVVAGLVLVLASGACASRKYVQRELTPVREQTAALEQQMEHAQDAIAANDRQLAEHEAEIETQSLALSDASATAREALERALEAGKLAEGKLLFETTFSEDRVRFGFDRAELPEEARQALDDLAATLKERDQQVYLEIQGHTDSTGNKAYNLELGERRAEAVRRYLNRRHGLPLHRMSVISYGESAPIADNATRDGRTKNRRVVVVVLR